MNENDRLPGKINFVQVTGEMISAGLERAFELRGEDDPRYLVSAIYLAMEYQRLHSLGQLTSLGDEVREIG